MEFGYILKGEFIGFFVGLDMGCERKEGMKDICKDFGLRNRKNRVVVNRSEDYG